MLSAKVICPEKVGGHLPVGSSPLTPPLSAAAERLESSKQRSDIRVVPRTNQELLALYRSRRAANRPRHKGRRYHLRDEELGDCLLEAELDQLE